MQRKRDYQGAWRRRAVGAAIAVAALFAMPAMASAATVSTSSNTITFQAAAGEANDVGVNTFVGTEVEFTDANPVTTTDPSCTQLAFNSVMCDVGNGAIFINLEDQNDSVDSSAIAMSTLVETGTGADTATTGPENDILRGNAGSDVDTLTGNGGGDFFDGGFGPDDISGGADSDMVSYEDRATGVEVLLADGLDNDGNADDGAENARDDLTSIEDVVGSPENDVISGDSNNNFIQGGLGADTLDGITGIDVLSYLDRGSSSPVTVALGATTGNGNADDDTGDSIDNFENLVGGDGADTLTGDSAANLIQGGGEADTINGGDSGDLLDGSDGNDVINGQGGDDGGIDAGLFGFDGSDAISGGPGNDSIEGGDDPDSASGGIGDDSIEGEADSDQGTIGGLTGLDGGDGDDKVEGGDGDDQLIGGNDTDLVSFEGSAGGVVASLGGTATGEGSDSLSGFEDLTGSNLDDELTGTTGPNTIDALDGADLLEGLAGADIFGGGAGSDTATYETEGATVADLATGATNSGGTDTYVGGIDNLIGSPEGDSLTGDAGQNTLSGGNGADTLIGLGEDDELTGSTGDDTLEPGAGDDTADGGSENDTVTYANNGESRVIINLVDDTSNENDSGTNDTLPGIENVIGSPNPSTDHITGDTGPNRIEGLAGSDTVFAGGGTDHVEGGADGDLVFAGDGNDTVAGNAGDDTLNGEGDVDTLSFAEAAGSVTADISSISVQDDGDGGSDFTSNIDFENLIGSPQGDNLEGRDGQANAIDGGGGNDTIQGRGGNDDLDGEGGTDTASYANAPSGVTVSLATETSSGGAGDDTLDEFENLRGANLHGDTLTGDGAANVLTGGGGDDTLTPGGGVDQVLAASGADDIFLRDDLGDTADCGLDIDVDTVEADGPAGTEILPNCESPDVVNVETSPPADPGTTTPPPTPAPKKCKKGEKLKKGKCVKKKKKKRKR